MNPIFDALWMGLISLARIIFHPIFWVVIFIVSSQHKKRMEAEIKILGMTRRGLLHRTMDSIILGLAGGLIGSILMILIGVSLRQEGIIYIWPTAILLFMIKSRYLCFSYAGGLLSLLYLIFGFPSIDVPGLMALVAILHFIESFLIFFNGDQDGLPIVVDHGNGKHIGGYSLQGFWPIPVIILTLLMDYPVDPNSLIEMPDWWPIIKPMGIQDMEGVTFLMVSIVAALGYGDLALTQVPKRKARRSALRLGIYSVILLILSIISSRTPIVQWVAALFAPIAHELLIIWGRKEEEEGQAIFTFPQRGVRVLDVLEGSASHRLNIGRGDIIYSINNIPVDSERDLRQILDQQPTFVWIEGEKLSGEKFTKELKAYPYGLRTLGILLLPEYSKITYVMKEKDGILKSFLNRIASKGNPPD